MERKIRYPNGRHEWCMVCRTPDFKSWGVSMDEIKRFTTKTRDLTWTNPRTGEPGRHGGNGSTEFHNKLKEIIDGSTSLEDFNREVLQLVNDWGIRPDLLPALLKGSG